MPTYKAPLDDMRFVLNEVLGVARLSSFKAFEALDDATINQFLEEVAKLSEDVLFPLNAAGDHAGCKHDATNKTVTTPPGFIAAYKQFCAAGLPGFACDPDFGGLGMPVVLNTAIAEMFCSANMAFGMYPGLSHGAYNALHEYGTPEQKKEYLPKLVSGEWTGTMCLTEPQCGTDLGLIKTKAVKQGDGSYKISGTKIFISAGEHDLSENIIHLVLARIEDPATPAGIRGISLFVVPKFIGATRNPAFCNRIEEKMGIHANSTCEMGFEEATGWLVGEAHKGMKAMFVMMNEARLGVGLQGLGLSEVAYQNGLAYALDRKQGRPIDAKDADGDAVSILHHADVRRELLTVKAQTEGARMLAYWVSQQLDISQKETDTAKKKQAKKLVDLLTPVIKAHMTDNAVDHTNAAMQVFGGHGYIREHGMEQFNRDARITRLYEGTNGIQALDFIGRKILKENLFAPYLKQMEADAGQARADGVASDMLAAQMAAARRLSCILKKLRRQAVFATLRGKIGLGGDIAPVMRNAEAMATDCLKMASLVVIGHMWLRMAGVAKRRLKDEGVDKDFYEGKIATAQFYFDRILPQTLAFEKIIASGSTSLAALPAESFTHGQTAIGQKTIG